MKTVLKVASILAVSILLALSMFPAAHGLNDKLTDDIEITYGKGHIYVAGTMNKYGDGSKLGIVIKDINDKKILDSYIQLHSSIFNGSFNTGVLPDGEYTAYLTYSQKMSPLSYQEVKFTITDTDAVKVTGISVSEHSLSLTEGNSKQLIANIEPSNATVKGVTWSSDDESVATVSNDGFVSAVKAGTADITVKTRDGDFTATCRINVTSGSSSSGISLSATTVSIYNDGEGITLYVTSPGINPSDLIWRTADANCVAFRNGNNTTDEILGKNQVVITGLNKGTTKITVLASNGSYAECTVTVTEKPADTSKEWYYFYIQFKEDSSAASGTKFAADAEKGFWLAGYGINAADALESVCNENGIEIMLVSKGSLRGWLGSFFGLGDVSQSGGDWKYWSQYKWTGANFSSSGSWSYNNSSLGYYDTGGTFALVRQITSVDGASAGISVKASDCPEGLRHDDSSVAITYNTQGGSVTSFTEKMKKGDPVDLSKSAGTREGYKFYGWNTSSSALTGLSSLTADSDMTLYAVWISESAEVIVTTNSDGSQTTTVKDEKQNEDGTTSSIIQSTTVKENEDGSTKTSVEKNETIKDSEGNVQSVVDEKSDESVSADGSVDKQTEKVVKDAEGKSLEETTTLKMTDTTTGVSTSAEIKKDSAGNTETSSISQVRIESTDGVAEINPSMIETAINQAERVKSVAAEKDVEIKHVLEIETKADQTAESSTVEMSAESLSKISDADIKLKLKTDVGEIEIPSEVAKNLSSGEMEKVSLEISKANKEQLNDKQQQAVGDSPVFNISAKLDETEIHELGGTVKITVPYELREGENPTKIAVWFIDELGNIVKNISEYDEETKTVMFETDHFSLYFIKEDLSDPAPIDPSYDDKKGGSNTVYYVAAVIAILAVIALALVILRKKNKL